MPQERTDLRPHFVLADTGQTERFRSTKSGNQKPPPNLDRRQHGQALHAQIADLKIQAAEATQALRGCGAITSEGPLSPLHLAFPAALASRWMPGLFPKKRDNKPRRRPLATRARVRVAASHRATGTAPSRSGGGCRPTPAPTP